MKDNIINMLLNYRKYLITHIKYEKDVETREYLIQLEANIQERLEYYENLKKHDDLDIELRKIEAEFITLKLSLSKK